VYWSIAAVAIGGGIGALARWLLTIYLNPKLPNLPLGTLASNLFAGYIIGVTMVLFTRYSSLPRPWPLFVNTGMMGGLSTFSTFSSEVTSHLLKHRWPWAYVEVVAHLVGSLLMTLLGVLTASWLIEGGNSLRE
jgi:fluoride exporter